MMKLMAGWQPMTRLFLRNFSIVLVFKALSLILTLVVYVLCVRELGVEAWGQVALITSIAGMLLIPLTFGLHNGVVKYVPVSSEGDSRALMGTAFAGNLVISVAVVLSFAASGPMVERFFGFPYAHWLWAIAVAMSINLYILAESFLRGQQQFFRIGSYKLYASVALLLGTVAILYGLNERSMSAYLLPFIAYNLLFFAGALAKSNLRPFKVTTQAWRMLFTFGFFSMLSWLFSTLLFTSDLYIVSRFGTAHDVGVYSVYQNNIRALCTILFHDVFAVVFLPMIAGMDKREVDRRAVRFAIPIFIVLAAGIGLLTTVVVLLLGQSVPLDWTYVALSAFGAAMNLMYLLYTSILSLDGVKAVRIAFISLLVPLPLLLWMQYSFVQEWGALGGMVSVIVLNALLLIIFRVAIRYFYPANPAVRTAEEADAAALTRVHGQAGQAQPPVRAENR